MARKPTPANKPVEPQLVTPDFRQQVHEMVDRALNEHPSTTGVLIGCAMGKDVDAASVPSNMAQKLGIIDQLYFLLHPEKQAELDLS